jgi:malonate transporter
MQALIDVIPPVFMVVGFGYVLAWREFLSDIAIDSIMKFAQQVAVPCLLFSALSQIDLSTGFDPALLLSFYTGAAISFALGLFGAHYIFGRSWEDSVVIGFCALFSNSVLLGLAITERAYGADALAGNYAIIALHSPFCYGLGITVMELVRAKEAGTSIAFAIPKPIQGGLDMMVRTALPTALFALGGILYRYRPAGDMKVILFACSLSLLVHPAITFTLGYVTSVSEAGMRSAVITSAMAPGVNAYIFASMYQRALRVAASTVLIATAFTVVSAWFWLTVLP